MRLLVKLLAVTTLLFAVSTFYFARLLQLEREHSAQLAARPVPAIRAIPVEAQPPVPPQPGGAIDAAQDAGGGNKADKRPDPGLLAVRRHRLEELRDPVARAARAKEIATLLREDWQTLAPQVGIPSSEFDQFITDMTEKTLQRVQRRLECEVDSTCDLDALDKAPGMSQDTMTAAVAGTADEYARRIESADGYTKQATDIAAAILDPGQLAAFKAAAQKTLYGYTERMHDAEISKAAREAPGGSP